MPIYDDVVKAVGAPPARPWEADVFGFKFNQGEVENWKAKRKIYDTLAQQAAQELTTQQLNPLRETTLGQIATLMGDKPEALASPEQYRARTVTEPSEVPSYRYVPTMTGEPEMARSSPGMVPRVTQLEGPYDLRQQPDVDGREQPREQHYPYRTDMVPQVGIAQPTGRMQEMQPQVRRVSAPLGGPRLTAQGPTYEPMPTGAVEPQARPDITYHKSEVNPEAASTLYQQMLGMAGIKREGTWPRSMGGSNAGVQTLQAKMNALISAGVPPDEAARVVAGGEVLQGGLKAQNLEQRTLTSGERAKNLSAGTDMMERKQGEIERQNAFMRDFKKRQLASQDAWHEKVQGAVDRKDNLALERLNEQRFWHDQLGAIFFGVDKADVLPQEQQEEALKAADVIKRMEERPPTPEELSFLEKLTGTTRPRYKYTPRPPLTQGGGPAPLSRPQGGVSQTAPMSFEGAPAGKQPGDTLKQDGKPVATWDGKTWQPMK